MEFLSPGSLEILCSERNTKHAAQTKLDNNYIIVQEATKAERLDLQPKAFKPWLSRPNKSSNHFWLVLSIFSFCRFGKDGQSQHQLTKIFAFRLKKPPTTVDFVPQGSYWVDRLKPDRKRESHASRHGVRW